MQFFLIIHQLSTQNLNVRKFNTKCENNDNKWP